MVSGVGVPHATACRVEHSVQAGDEHVHGDVGAQRFVAPYSLRFGNWPSGRLQSWRCKGGWRSPEYRQEGIGAPKSTLVPSPDPHFTSSFPLSAAARSLHRGQAQPVYSRPQFEPLPSSSSTSAWIRSRSALRRTQRCWAPEGWRVLFSASWRMHASSRPITPEAVMENLFEDQLT